MEGFPKAEIIINENANFDSKFAYYKKAYNENLTLKSFNGIKIVGFTYGDTFKQWIKRDKIKKEYFKKVKSVI